MLGGRAARVPDKFHVGADVSVTVLAADDWYSTVTLIGHVSDWRDDNDLTDIDRISTHYGGRPYPVRDRGRVSAWITVDRWYGWGSLQEDTQAG